MLGLVLGVPGVSTTYRLLASVVEFLLSCKPCLFAIAIGIAWVAGDIHGHRKEGATWSAKWAAAEAKSERDRQARDALVKAKIEKDATDRVTGISARADELEKKVESYERDEQLRRATGNGAAGFNACLTDQSDDDWLRDIRRKRKRPGANIGGRFTERLRSHFAASPDPGKH